MSSPKITFSGEGATSVVRNAAYIVGGRWVQTGLRFLYVIVLTRYLNPELYGIFNYGLAFYLAFLPITGLGLGVILSREIGRNRNHGVQIVSQALSLRFFVAILAAGMCALAGWFSEVLPEVRQLLLLFSVALVGRAVSTWSENVFTAYETNKYLFQQQAIFRSLEVVLGTILLLCKAELTSVVTIHVISWWLQALGGLIVVRRHIASAHIDATWRDLKRLFVQGLPIGLGVLMVNWLQQGPIVLSRHMLGSMDSLAQFALAMQAFMALSTVPMAAGIAALPILSRTVARQDGKDTLFCDISLRAALIIGAAVGLVGLAAGPYIVNFAFGDRYTEAGQLLGPTLWLLIPWACASTTWHVYLARGEFFVPIAFAGGGVLVLTLLFPWSVQAMHTLGAVVATGVAIATWALGLIIMLVRSGDLNLGRDVLRPLGVVLLALAVFLVLQRVNIWLSLFASLLALFGGTIIFGVLAPDERFALIRFVRMRFKNSKDNVGPGK